MPWTLSGRPWTTMTSTRLWRPAVLVKTRVILIKGFSPLACNAWSLQENLACLAVNQSV